MKNLKTSLFFFVLLIFAFPGLTQTPDGLDPDKADNADAMLAAGLKRYPVESGFIKYKASGKMEGTITLYFDKWGWREIRIEEKSLEMFGRTTEVKELSMLDGEIQIKADLVKKTGTVMRNFAVKPLSESDEEGDLSASGKKMLEGMGGKLIGTETIAGKKCEIYEVEDLKVKTWIWQGLTLKTESNFMNMEIVEEAIEVQTDTPIDEAKFILPEDLELRNIGDIEGY